MLNEQLNLKKDHGQASAARSVAQRPDLRYERCCESEIPIEKKPMHWHLHLLLVVVVDLMRNSPFFGQLPSWEYSNDIRPP